MFEKLISHPLHPAWRFICLGEQPHSLQCRVLNRPADDIFTQNMFTPGIWITFEQILAHNIKFVPKTEQSI